jgi:hypothetical protein
VHAHARRKASHSVHAARAHPRPACDCSATPSTVSWLGDHFKLHGLMCQFFWKLPASAARAAAAVALDHAASLADPRQADELSVVVQFAATALPDVAERRLLTPTMKSIGEDVAAEPADGATARVSNARSDAVCWRMGSVWALEHVPLESTRPVLMG